MCFIINGKTHLAILVRGDAFPCLSLGGIARPPPALPDDIVNKQTVFERVLPAHPSPIPCCI